jgi:integrase
MKVAEARVKAGRWYELVKQGIDPEQAEAEARSKLEATRRAKRRNRPVLSGCTLNNTSPKNQSPAGGRRGGNTTYADPAFGPMPLHLITPRDVRELMDTLRKRAPYSALNAWTNLTQIMKRAVHEELIPVSPLASLDKKLVFGNSNTGARQRVLNDQEVFAFWRAAGKLGYPAGPFYQLLLLTGVRLRELLEARWAEFHPELRQLIRQASSTGQTGRLDVCRQRCQDLDGSRASGSSQMPSTWCRCPMRPAASSKAFHAFAGCDYLFTANGQTPVWASRR